jgi:hypothetical protein
MRYIAFIARLGPSCAFRSIIARTLEAISAKSISASQRFTPQHPSARHLLAIGPIRRACPLDARLPASHSAVSDQRIAVWLAVLDL